MIQFRVLAGPVLKHGPRSLACMRVIEIVKLKGATKVKARIKRAQGGWSVAFGRPLALSRRLVSKLWMQARSEHKCWDPKDGELCLVRSKSGETWMEDRSDSDVQIDRRNWV
ncbi:unnamed protein product [Arctia plantaginis]|uniref:Uncharacterized protein n=1 Tax=Arctia plantaginis TaxID=874455 RepID=A0A8S1AYQ2_ARCPL|nr:unnamed protein product [Arctia plantaginis]